MVTISHLKGLDTLVRSFETELQSKFKMDVNIKHSFELPFDLLNLMEISNRIN